MEDSSKGLSNKAYARYRKERNLPGGTHQAVKKALERGRICKNEYGLIDPRQSDVDWSENTSWSMQRHENKSLD